MAEHSFAEGAGRAFAVVALSAGAGVGVYAGDEAHDRWVVPPIEVDMGCIDTLEGSDERFVPAEAFCVDRVSDRYGSEPGFGPLEDGGLAAGFKLPTQEEMLNETQQRMDKAESDRKWHMIQGAVAVTIGLYAVSRVLGYARRKWPDRLIRDGLSNIFGGEDETTNPKQQASSHS